MNLIYFDISLPDDFSYSHRTLNIHNIYYYSTILQIGNFGLLLPLGQWLSGKKPDFLLSSAHDIMFIM